MIEGRQTVKLFLIVGLLISLTFPFLILAEELSLERIVIYFFYRQGCFHCAKEEKFLEKIEKKYPEIEIRKYEVLYNSENQKIFQEFLQKYQAPPLAGVPLTIIGEKYFLGYQSDETTGKEIESYLKSLLKREKPKEEINRIKIPILGEVELRKISLPLLTITLGALDGFNPCAMWVLLFLIFLLINIRSRQRLFLVAGTFILTSGIVYFLILAGWLKLFLTIFYINLTRILIGVFALGFGIFQIRNFLKYKGACPITEGNTLKGKIKSSLMDRAQKIVFSPFSPVIFFGIIILALGINLIEFFCSAGLPAVFTRILALNQLPVPTYYFYLLLYTFVFMLDDLIILSLALITLNKIGFTQKYNYWATLIGGLLIFILGILLIFKPELLIFG